MIFNGFSQRTLLEENIDELEELADSGTDLTDAQSKLLATCHERMQVRGTCPFCLHHVCTY